MDTDRLSFSRLEQETVSSRSESLEDSVLHVSL